MNDLLFTALTIATLYYFFYYLPKQKKLNAHQLIRVSQAVQTEPLADEKVKELEAELQTKQKQIREKDTQITKLQTQIRDLAKRALKPTNSKGIQTITPDNQELENTLDTLIKDIQEFNLKI